MCIKKLDAEISFLSNRVFNLVRGLSIKSYLLASFIKFKKKSHYFSGVMALRKFGHFKLVSNISQKLFELRA